jgi:hypothetical protein
VRQRRRRIAGSIAAAVAAALVPVAAAHATATLTTGFSDDALLLSPTASVRAEGLTRAVGEHAGIVRLNVRWARIARGVPAGDVQASDPSWAGYELSTLDAAVRDASGHGLQVLLTVLEAPRFAEGDGRPAAAPPGSWMPRPSALAAFARALALRYSGGYVPRGASAPLPRVRYWQAWNEPNLSLYLTPQWRRVRHGYAPASPLLYRRMLNAFYASVHSVQRDAAVLSGGTGPYGDRPGGARMPPAQFVRELLCLREPGLVSEHCRDPARFDILDHHPYSVAGPTFEALNPDDAAIVDMARLIRPLRKAERLRLVGGASRHGVWVTETSWDTNPPDPHGVPIATQARWLAQAFYLLWRQGVTTVMWLLVIDAPPIPDYASTYQSGTYLLDGSAKPSAQAFRFPFVALRQTHRSVLVWGKAPVGGAVQIERKVGATWTPVRAIVPARVGVFEARVALRGRTELRARAGGEVSVVWQEAG